jgi:hypothetical protein
MWLIVDGGGIERAGNSYSYLRQRTHTPDPQQPIRITSGD